MQISDKPTGYIMLPVESTIEWCECDFMIVAVTPAWQAATAERQQLLKLFNKDNDFSALIYSATVEGFFTYPDAGNKLETGRQRWCFIETTPDEIANLPEVDVEITGCHLAFDNTGLAWYTASTPHTDCELSTNTFNIRQLLALLQNTSLK